MAIVIVLVIVMAIVITNSSERYVGVIAITIVIQICVRVIIIVIQICVIVIIIVIQVKRYDEARRRGAQYRLMCTQVVYFIQEVYDKYTRKSATKLTDKRAISKGASDVAATTITKLNKTNRQKIITKLNKTNRQKSHIQGHKRRRCYYYYYYYQTKHYQTKPQQSALQMGKRDILEGQKGYLYYYYFALPRGKRDLWKGRSDLLNDRRVLCGM